MKCVPEIRRRWSPANVRLRRNAHSGEVNVPRGSRLPNARPKLMFDHVDQSFLQIVWFISFAVHLEHEEFPTKFAQGYCARASDEFCPPGSIKSKIQGWSRRTIQPNKQRFELVCNQTNTKQTSDKVARAGRFNVFVSS